MKFFRKRKPSQIKDAKFSVSIPTIKHFNFSKQEEYKKYAKEHIAWRLKDTRSEMLKENMNDFKLRSGFALETEPNFQHKYKIANSPNDCISYIQGDILYLNEIESKKYFNLITNL